MKRAMSLILSGVIMTVTVGVARAADAPALPEVTLTRLDCGVNTSNPVDVSARFSNTYAYNELKVNLTYSC